MLHPLDHELSDTVAPTENEGLHWIEVDEDDLYFASVARVHSAWCVDDGNPMAGSQARSGMDEASKPHWQGDRDTRR
jgi:hypothetical protein